MVAAAATRLGLRRDSQLVPSTVSCSIEIATVEKFSYAAK
jgi:hypothetical protein